MRSVAVPLAGRPTRAVAICVLGLLVAAVLPMTQAEAAGWPSVFHAYGRFDGTTFNDPIDQPGGLTIADLSSGVTTTASGPLPSTYIAADGTDLLVRFRLKESPGLTPSTWDTTKGGLTNNAYVVQIGVNGTHVASVGLDGKTSANDYVYVAPVADVTIGGTQYTAANPRVVSTWDGSQIPGARLSSAGTPGAPAETFLDFRVPLAEITLVAPTVTATTPLQFFYGTSAAANLTTINKDYMSNAGTSCAEVGCAEVIIGPSRIGLTWTDTPTHAAGPNPPEAGVESRYDLTITATNTGLNELSSINVVDDLPVGLTAISATTASGTASVTDQHLQWTPAPLAPGQEVALTLRVAITPAAADAGSLLQLSPGPAATAVDLASATSSSASLSAVDVGPVAGEPPAPEASEEPTDEPTTTPTDEPTTTPTDEPTPTPTDEPTPTPTDEPTMAPTDEPTAGPTTPPSEAPTASPTDEPTPGPTDEPTPDPTEKPPETTDPEPDPDGDADPDPIAVDDAAGGRTGEAVTVDVLANDSAPGSWLLPGSVSTVRPMTHGDILSVNPFTGAVTYRPDAGYEGVDGFRYRVCNALRRCVTADVSTATPPVDLEVTVVRTGPHVRVGQPATYAVTVTNLGPRVAEAPLTLTLVTSGLGNARAAGDGWSSVEHAVLTAASAAAMPQVFAADPLTLQLPTDLTVDEPSVVTLTGIVTGAAGDQVRVDAEVGGPTIELEYANNESSARDRIAAADSDDSADPDDTDPENPDDPTDPVDPTDPADPTDPTDPADPRDPVEPTILDPVAPRDDTAGDGAARERRDRTLAATGAGTVTMLIAALAFLAAGLALRRVRPSSPQGPGPATRTTRGRRSG